MEEKRLKIAFVLCSLGVGGAERFILELIKNLDQQRFEIQLITVKGGGELLSEFQKLGITIKLFDKKTKLGLGVIWQLFKYFKKEKFDLVHTNLFASDTWGRIAAWLAGVPVIISTEHNLNVDEGVFKKLIKRVLSRVTQRIIAVSQAVKDYQVAIEKIKPQKIQVIYNGIDLVKFGFLKHYQFHQQSPTLGIVGRLEEQKGHCLLLDSLALVRKSGQDFKLLIVGQGSLENKITEQIKILKLESAVQLIPFQLDIRSIFESLDLLIVPSLWEGLGIIALEALACGLPVLASDIDGLKEIIISQKNGFLFSHGDSHQLAVIIRQIIDQPENLAKIREKGRLTVEQKFDIKKISQAYQRVFWKSYEDSVNQ